MSTSRLSGGRMKTYTLPAHAENVDLVTVPVRRGMGLVEPLLRVVNGKGWIAGGFARWCCSPSAEIALPVDIDVFFADLSDVNVTVGKLKELGAKVVKEVPYFVQLDVSAAFPGFGLPAVQLVKPNVRPDGTAAWGPTKEDIVRQIDLTVCRVALDGLGRSTATADPLFETDELAKRIRFKCIKFPPAEMRHAFKYAAKGYTLSLTDASELLENWVQRDPEERIALSHNSDNDRGGY